VAALARRAAELGREERRVMSVQGAKRIIGSGFLLMGLGQYFHESSCQDLQQIVGTMVGCKWNYIEAALVLIGIVVTSIGLRQWVTTALAEMCRPTEVLPRRQVG